MSSGKRILILFAHPAFHRSRIHRRMAAAARRVEGVTFHDLYEEYPHLHIRARREQELLRGHEIVVFQHPLYWYSAPAILKEWMDLVLEHGFAYGEGGTALMGKKLLSAISTGGPEESYRADGYNNFTIGQLLAPFQQTARLCGMRWLPPFVVHGSPGLREAGETETERHAANYADLLTALRDGRLDAGKWAGLERINALPVGELVV